MTSQRQKAQTFADLHVKGDPLIIFNIWDVGSAVAVQDARAKALATGSWSVAVANGYPDGESIPLGESIANLRRIVWSTSLPVSLDFERGYTGDIDQLKLNTKLVLEAGAIGVNFEDGRVGGRGEYSIEEQCQRISAMREAVRKSGVAFFINARTDVFLAKGFSGHPERMDEAIERSKAYADAGANGFFAPGLQDAELIKRLCDECPLPLNIMVLPDTPPRAELAAMGVARISYGPGPFRRTMDFIKDAAKKAFAE